MSAVIVCERSSEEKNAKRWKVRRTDASDNIRREEEQIKLGSGAVNGPTAGCWEYEDCQHPAVEIKNNMKFTVTFKGNKRFTKNLFYDMNQSSFNRLIRSDLAPSPAVVKCASGVSALGDKRPLEPVQSNVFSFYICQAFTHAQTEVAATGAY